jgi:hypothetical protein
VLLLFSIGDGAAARGLDRAQSEVWRPAQVNEGAGGGDRSAANASPAMDADPFAGAESIGQVDNKRSEGAPVRRDMVIGNGVVEELHSHPLCQLALFGQIKHTHLLLIEERDKRIDAGALQMEQIGVQGAAAARAQSDCQRRGDKRRGWMAVDPVDAVQGDSNSDELLDAVVDGGDGQT